MIQDKPQLFMMVKFQNLIIPLDSMLFSQYCIKFVQCSFDMNEICCCYDCTIVNAFGIVISGILTGDNKHRF